MKIHTNHIEIYYTQCGSGTPLILLHGNGENHHIFDALTAHLQQHFCVYALDSRNHGQSSHTGIYDYDVMAEDVHTFIQALDLGQVNLLGFSDGAIISLLLAIRHPQQIKRMALLGVNLRPEDFDAESYQYVKETWENTHAPLFRLMLEQPDIALESLGNVDIPTLLVAGENDIYRPELYDDLLNTLPQAELKIMTGHDHGSYIIGQHLLYPELLRFFSGTAC